MVKKASIELTLKQLSKFSEVEVAQILAAYINKDGKALKKFFPNVSENKDLKKQYDNFYGAARRIANGMKQIAQPTNQTQQILTKQYNIPANTAVEQIFTVWKQKGLQKHPQIKLNKKRLQKSWIYRNLGNSTDESTILEAIESIAANELRSNRRALAVLTCMNENNVEYSIGTSYLILNPWDIYNDLLFKIPLTGRTGKSWDYGESQYYKSLSMLAE